MGKSFTPLKKLRNAYAPYYRSLFDILKYQAVSGACLAVLLWAIGRLTAALIRSAGRVAVTSGDFMFLFTTWQGVLLILFALISLALYAASDLYTKTAYASDLINGKDSPLFANIRRSFLAARKFLTPAGFLVLIYLSLVAPLLGTGISISLTEGLYIPTFIMSVITETPLYNAVYILALIVFFIAGFLNAFVLQGIIIDGLSVKASMKQSVSLIRKNWKDFIRQQFLFSAATLLVNAAILLFCFFIPIFLILLLNLDPLTDRFFLIFLTFLTVGTAFVVNSYDTPFQIIKNTQLYYSYRNRTPAVIPVREKKKHPAAAVIAAIVIAFLVLLSYLANSHFDTLFPKETDVRIIAHRAGGTEAPENTVKGIEAAIGAGAYGAEIDIQRTADGHYIVNHDTTFERTAGSRRRPGDMTLEEIRKLSVSGEPVATLEEMLDAAKGRIILFIELKGGSADRRMVDDAVRIILERGMQDECVLISLKYDMIDYAERAYPEIQTGFLTFLAFGNTEQLNCDFIGLEEESATEASIRSIHDQGKKVLVWTPNSKESQKHFLLSQADAVITDRIRQANELILELAERSDIECFYDSLLAGTALRKGAF